MSNPNHELDHALEALYASGPPKDLTEAAYNRLLEKIDKAMPPKIYYDEIPNSPIGNVWIAISDKGLFEIDFDIGEDEFLANTQKMIRARFIRDEEMVAPFLIKVKQYLSGKITVLDVEVDLRSATDFQRKVLMAALEVPRGQVATYAEIAERIGKPKAFRAVGQALRHNPIPIVIPCHRVIASDGTLGGYGGVMGSERKIKLLKLEGVMLA